MKYERVTYIVQGAASPNKLTKVDSNLLSQLASDAAMKAGKSCLQVVKISSAVGEVQACKKVRC